MLDGLRLCLMIVRGCRSRAQIGHHSLSLYRDTPRKANKLTKITRSSSVHDRLFLIYVLHLPLGLLFSGVGPKRCEGFCLSRFLILSLHLCLSPRSSPVFPVARIFGNFGVLWLLLVLLLRSLLLLLYSYSHSYCHYDKDCYYKLPLLLLTTTRCLLFAS